MGTMNYSPQRLALIRRAARLSRSGVSIEKQARQMHVGRQRLLDLRHQATQAGFKVAPAMDRRRAPESRAWARVDNVLGTCGRCGLRGQHECLPPIDARARTGVGRVYPESPGA